MKIANLFALVLLASASLAAGSASADNGAAPGNKAGSAGYAGSTPSNDETSKPNNGDMAYKSRCHGLKDAERQHCLDDEKDARARAKDAARVQRDQVQK
jgi:opacity protein-like surface antigen